MLIGFIVFLAALAYGTYFLTSKLKNKQMQQISNNHFMRVVDGMDVGLNQSVRLIQVGEELVLFSTGVRGVTMMKLDDRQIKKVIDKDGFEDLLGEGNPSTTMKDVTKNLMERLKKNEKN